MTDQPRRRAFLLAGFLPALVRGQSAAPPRVPPVDQSDRDASFAAFRRHLLDVIARRDVRALLAAVDPEVRMSARNRPEGRDEFARFWQLSRPAASGVWAVLARVLELGCVEDQHRGGFLAPSISARLPAGVNADWHEIVATADEPLRARPEAGAPVVMMLDWHVVKRVPTAAPVPEGWMAVEVPGGPQGFVRKATLHNPLGYRALFQRRGGEWRITILQSGD
jgi:hypothetical protein